MVTGCAKSGVMKMKVCRGGPKRVTKRRKGERKDESEGPLSRQSNAGSESDESRRLLVDLSRRKLQAALILGEQSGDDLDFLRLWRLFMNPVHEAGGGPDCRAHVVIYIALTCIFSPTRVSREENLEGEEGAESFPSFQNHQKRPYRCTCAPPHRIRANFSSRIRLSWPRPA
jgi:hypothetical protein